MKKHIGHIDFFELDKGVLAVIGEPYEPIEIKVSEKDAEAIKTSMREHAEPLIMASYTASISNPGIEIYAEKGSTLMAEVTRTMKKKQGWK